MDQLKDPPLQRWKLPNEKHDPAERHNAVAEEIAEDDPRGLDVSGAARRHVAGMSAPIPHETEADVQAGTLPGPAVRPTCG